MKCFKLTPPTTRRILAILLNIAIIALELVGLVLEAKNQGTRLFIYYTEDSNILLLLASILFVVFASAELISGKPLPRFVQILKYVATCVVTVTFTVVVAVLAPMAGSMIAGLSDLGEAYRFLMLEGSMLYHHFLCPVLAMVSFILLEDKPALKVKETIYALIPTILYAVVSISLNIARVWEGPYPFLYVYAQPWYMSVIWFFTIDGSAYLFALLIWLANIKMGKLYSRLDDKNCPKTDDTADVAAEA